MVNKVPRSCLESGAVTYYLMAASGRPVPTRRAGLVREAEDR
jgi:hypothetical protein